jgi:lysozyme
MTRNEYEVGMCLLKFLESVEGRRARIYSDVGGQPTIGIGHMLTPSERKSGKIRIAGNPVIYRNGLSDEDIDRLCLQDAERAARAVRVYVNVPLEENQFNALVSFVFNVGEEAFRWSTLLRRLNLGDYESVPGQLKRWVYSCGAKIRGLAIRRQKEIEEWNNCQD